MKYDDELRKYCAAYMFEPRDEVTLREIEAVFKECCPGNYHLEWALNDKEDSTTLTTLEVDVVFDSAEERILFLLKYS